MWRLRPYRNFRRRAERGEPSTIVGPVFDWWPSAAPGCSPEVLFSQSCAKWRRRRRGRSLRSLWPFPPSVHRQGTRTDIIQRWSNLSTPGSFSPTKCDVGPETTTADARKTRLLTLVAPFSYCSSGPTWVRSSGGEGRGRCRRQLPRGVDRQMAPLRRDLARDRHARRGDHRQRHERHHSVGRIAPRKAAPRSSSSRPTASAPPAS